MLLLLWHFLFGFLLLFVLFRGVLLLRLLLVYLGRIFFLFLLLQLSVILMLFLLLLFLLLWLFLFLLFLVLWLLTILLLFFLIIFLLLLFLFFWWLLIILYFIFVYFLFSNVFLSFWLFLFALFILFLALTFFFFIIFLFITHIIFFLLLFFISCKLSQLDPMILQINMPHTFELFCGFQSFDGPHKLAKFYFIFYPFNQSIITFINLYDYFLKLLITDFLFEGLSHNPIVNITQYLDMNNYCCITIFNRLITRL